MGRAAWDLDLIAFSSHLLCNVDGDHEEDESHADKIQSNLAKPPYPPPRPHTHTRSLTTQGFMLSPFPYPPSPSCPGRGEDVGSLSESHVWDGLASPKHGTQKSNPYISMWEVEGVSCSSQRFYLDLN